MITCSACSTQNDPKAVLCSTCGQPLQMTVLSKKALTVGQPNVALASMSTPGIAHNVGNTNVVTRLVPVDSVGNLDYSNPINLPSGAFERIMGWHNANSAPSVIPIIDMYRLYRDQISIPDPNGGRQVGISRQGMRIYREAMGPLFVHALESMHNKLWIMYSGQNAIEVIPGDQYFVYPGVSIFFGIDHVGMTMVAE